MHRVNHVEHGGVVSHEVDHLVWVILGGLHVWGERAAGTLVKIRRREKKNNHIVSNASFLRKFWWTKIHVLERDFFFKYILASADTLTVPGRG